MSRDGRLIDTALAGDITVRPLAPFVVFQQRQQGLPLVGIRAAKAVGGIGPNGVEDGFALCPLVDEGEDVVALDLPVRPVAMEAIGQPVRRAVEEHDHRL